MEIEKFPPEHTGWGRYKEIDIKYDIVQLYKNRKVERYKIIIMFKNLMGME